MKFYEYPSSTTSFSKVVEPFATSVRGEGVVVVLDAVGRVEMLVRQLRRQEEEPGEYLVVSTAEGIGPRAIGTGHEALDGVRVVPVAVAGREDAPFVSAFERRQGELPGEQALLVWRALSAAFAGASAPPEPAVAVVKGGRLVPFTAK